MLQGHIWKAGAYSKHAPGAVCISDMVLEHIWLGKFFQIMNGPGPYVLTIQDHMVLDHKSRPKSQKRDLTFRKASSPHE